MKQDRKIYEAAHKRYLKRCKKTKHMPNKFLKAYIDSIHGQRERFKKIDKDISAYIIFNLSTRGEGKSLHKDEQE